MTSSLRALFSALFSGAPANAAAPVQPNDALGNRLRGFSARFWLLLVLTGIGAGVAAGLLMLLLRATEHLTWSYRSGNLLDAVQHVSPTYRVLALLAAGIVASVGVALLKHGSGGSGGKLNERIWFHSGRLVEGKTIAQSVLSIVIVGMGASLGRETAPKQTGAAIASWLARRAALSSAECRLLAACGAGAGMGAVYNVPLGGGLFALEVLLGTIALPLIPPALAASTIATATAYLLLPDQPSYTIAAAAVTLPQLVWSVVFGPIAGLASVLYVRLLVAADTVKPRGRAVLLLPPLAFAAVGLLAIPYPQLLGNGRDAVQLAFDARLGLPLLAALLVLKPLATAACLGSGAPGGLFTPTITFGAMLGGLLGGAWSLLWPGGEVGNYALIGAAAVLAASMQAPVAALVLMLELTQGISSLAVPVLLAVAGAAVTARHIDARSIYSGRVHAARQIDVRGAGRELRYADLLQAAPNTVSVAATYPEVLERLVATGDAASPLYVIDETAKFLGRIVMRRARTPPPLTEVLSAGAAGDLLEPVSPLGAGLSETDALARLRAEPAGELPVVDEGGRLLAVASLPERAEARGRPAAVAMDR
ncbi:MAG: chloride channel protein [Acidisphaera sp.]|nr:chloride channel protein [Acidisphaera sp.]